MTAKIGGFEMKFFLREQLAFFSFVNDKIQHRRNFGFVKKKLFQAFSLCKHGYVFYRQEYIVFHDVMMLLEHKLFLLSETI